MNDSPPTTDWSSDTLKAEGLALIQQQHPELLLERHEQGEILVKQAAVIRAQNRTIEHQAHTIAHLIEEIGQYQDIIAMLCGEDGAA